MSGAASLVDILSCEDPASLVEPLLSLAKAIPEPKFEAAVRKQIDYLMKEDTARTADGTLSHRIDKVQLWVDGIYMVLCSALLLSQHYDMVFNRVRQHWRLQAFIGKTKDLLTKR